MKSQLNEDLYNIEFEKWLEKFQEITRQILEFL